MVDAPSRLACTKCGTLIPEEWWNAAELNLCTGCDSPVRAMVFPAAFLQPQPAKADASAEGDATCFFHPSKKAAVPCDQCGRFLCSLCDLEFRGQHWCPSCMSTGKKQRKVETLEDRRTNYDSLALAVAVLPGLLIWPTIISGPVALYLTIRYWRKPLSIVRRSRIRYYLAAIIGGAQTVGWAWLISYFMLR
ncbi:MAG: hypothetical protein ACRD8O_11380 [Bryobacteraceae bacterium]